MWYIVGRFFTADVAMPLDNSRTLNRDCPPASRRKFHKSTALFFEPADTFCEKEITMAAHFGLPTPVSFWVNPSPRWRSAWDTHRAFTRPYAYLSSLRLNAVLPCGGGKGTF